MTVRPQLFVCGRHNGTVNKGSSSYLSSWIASSSKSFSRPHSSAKPISRHLTPSTILSNKAVCLLHCTHRRTSKQPKTTQPQPCWCRSLRLEVVKCVRKIISELPTPYISSTMASTITNLAYCLWEMFMGPGEVPPSDDYFTVSCSETPAVDQSEFRYAANTYDQALDPSVSTYVRANHDWHTWATSPTVDPSYLTITHGSAAGSSFPCPSSFTRSSYSSYSEVNSATSTSSSYLEESSATSYDDEFDGCPDNPYDLTRDSRYDANFWQKHFPDPENLFVRVSSRIAKSEDGCVSPRSTSPSSYFT